MLKTVFSMAFILNALIFFFQAMSKNIFPPLLPPLMGFFVIGEEKAGLLVTLVFMGYALARFPSGLLADKIGYAKTVLLGSVTMAFSFIMVGMAPGYYSMALLTFILGVTSGIYVTAGYTLAVKMGTQGRAATSTALFEMFGIIAGIISPMLVTFFVLQLSWRYLFILSGAALLLVSFLFYLKDNSTPYYGGVSTIPRKGVANNNGTALSNSDALNGSNVASDREAVKETGVTKEKADSNRIRSLKEGLLDSLSFIIKDTQIRRFMIWSTLVGGLGAITWTGASSFIPTLLVNEKGYEYETANKMFTLVAFSALFTKVAIGWLGDRFGTRRLLVGTLGIKAVSVLALVLAQSHWLLLLLLMFLGGTSLNSNTLINSYVLRNMPREYQATGFGLFSTAYTVIYSCGPFITGLLSVQLNLGTAMAISTLGAFTAILLLFLFPLFFPQSPKVEGGYRSRQWEG